MNFGNITQIAFVISSLIMIPLISGNITLDNRDISGLAFSLNSSFVENNYSDYYSIKKEHLGEKVVYTYLTPYGKFTFSISPEKFEGEVFRIGRKVKVMYSSSEKVYELWEPEKYLKINTTPFRIESYLKTPYGSITFISQDGKNSTQISGYLPKNALIEILRESEQILYQEVELLKISTEEITGVRKVEITYLNCSGSKEKEYVEITNTGIVPVNLRGYVLKDMEGTNTKSYEFEDIILKPGESIKFDSSVTGITWNNKGDTAVLINPLGIIVSQRSCDE